jgi:hypothetical protein
MLDAIFRVDGWATPHDVAAGLQWGLRARHQCHANINRGGRDSDPAVFDGLATMNEPDQNPYPKREERIIY